jgi:GNAT superfamily N-acetyltransferase
MDNYIIREGEERDIKNILVMAERCWEHTIYEEKFNAEIPELLLLGCIENNLLSVLEVDGVLNGFAASVKAPLMASSEAYNGTEIGLWLEPEHRKGGKGVRLIKHIESLAKKSGIKYFNLVFMMSLMPEIMQGIYEAIGYTKSEVVYTKVL